MSPKKSNLVFEWKTEMCKEPYRSRKYLQKDTIKMIIIWQQLDCVVYKVYRSCSVGEQYVTCVHKVNKTLKETFIAQALESFYMSI